MMMLAIAIAMTAFGGTGAGGPSPNALLAEDDSALMAESGDDLEIE